MNRTYLAGLAGALLSAAVLGTSVAVASIPSTANGSITSCVNTTTSGVRIIDYQAGQRCHSTERTLSWSSGPRAHVFDTGWRTFTADASLHYVTAVTLPATGAWSLDAHVQLHAHVSWGVNDYPGASVYLNCELRNGLNVGIDYTDAAILTDTYGNAWTSGSINGTQTAAPTTRTTALWCRADKNSRPETTLTTSVRLHLVATRIAGGI